MNTKYEIQKINKNKKGPEEQLHRRKELKNNREEQPNKLKLKLKLKNDISTKYEKATTTENNRKSKASRNQYN